MAHLAEGVANWYTDLMENRSDPRVADWPMMSSPLPTMALCIGYAWFSKSLGPNLMKNRQPFNLRTILVLYNLGQTIFSAWLFYEYLQSGWWGHYSFRCQPVDYSTSDIALRMANTCWWYYFSKFTEFCDTLFFILRKKNEHVSTLHVIHHGCMPFSVWMGLKFAPGGHSTFFALLNTFVHIIMYFYYMVTAMGPKYAKYIWWKKYLTTLQMVQFVGIMTHQFQLLWTECDYPRVFMVWIALHGIMFLFLFSDFYKVKYSKAKIMNGKLKVDKQNGIEHETHKSKSNGYTKDLKSTYATNGQVYEEIYSNGTGSGYKESAGNGITKRLYKEQ